MTMMAPETEKQLQRSFYYFNKGMLLVWRLGLGRWINLWPNGTGRIMVLTHTGRKSGIRRRTPVNYAVVDEDVFCTAGFGTASDWYRNIRVNPQVEVWLPDGWYSGFAEDITACPEYPDLMRRVLVASGFAARVFGINPKKLTDDDIQKITTNYRLVRIRLTSPRTGAGGPGDLDWIWPLATLFLLQRLLIRPKGRPLGRRGKK